MKKTIDEVFELSQGGHITFGFQGGEPLLAPLTYFREFINYVNDHQHGSSTISYTIQTNGTLMTEEHARFFKENNFLVGLSLDGGEKIHNLFRIDSMGRPSYEGVIRALDILQKFDVPFNVLIVVTHQSAPHVKDIYEDLKQKGIMQMQFIPVIEPLHVPPFSMDYALTQDDYAQVHQVLWDLYQQDRSQGKLIFVRYFDNLRRMMQNQRVEQCGVSGMCHAQIVVESNGDIYPCDFYSDHDHVLGNIMNDRLLDLVKHPRMKTFILDSLKIHEDCQTCQYYHLCRGGCKRYHHHTQEQGGKNRYCEGIKQFLNHILSHP